MPLPSRRQRATTAPAVREWSPEVIVLDDDKYVLIFEAKLSGVRRVDENIRVQVYDRTLTIRATRPDPEATEADFRGYPVIDSKGVERIVVGPPMQSFERSAALPSKVDPTKACAFFQDKDEVLVVRFPKTDLPANTEVSAETAPERRRRAISALTGRRIPFGDEASRTPITIDFLTRGSASIPAPLIHTYGGRMLEDDRIITKEGSRYFPISLAAQEGQVPRTTLVDWIKAKKEFTGRPLQTYQSPTAKQLYLAEESLERVANRFIWWPSKEPAGSVHLGQTKDKSGYIGIAKAARAIGVDHHTMWLWTAHGAVPTEKPLDVIKCTASDQLYIHEKELSRLKKLVPRSGLRRGPRPRQASPYKTPIN